MSGTAVPATRVGVASGVCANRALPNISHIIVPALCDSELDDSPLCLTATERDTTSASARCSTCSISGSKYLLGYAMHRTSLRHYFLWK
jgi:hypothetical protein